MTLRLLATCQPGAQKDSGENIRPQIETDLVSLFSLIITTTGIHAYRNRYSTVNETVTSVC